MKVYSLNDLSLHDCHCPQRVQAQREGRFFYIPLHHGYVWADSEGVPRRKDGRPFVFTCCPFCGGSLDDRGECGW